MSIVLNANDATVLSTVRECVLKEVQSVVCKKSDGGERKKCPTNKKIRMIAYGNYEPGSFGF